MSHAKNFDFPPQQMGGLSDEVLLGIVQSGIHELRQRPSISPDRFTELGLKASRPVVVSGLAIPGSTVLADGDLEIFHAEGRVEIDGKARRFPRIIFNILSLLAINADQIVTRDTLFKTVWGSSTIDQHPTEMTSTDINKVDGGVHRLRLRLGVDDLGHMQHGVIQSIYGHGLVGLTRRPERY